jgi:tetratricopeptide (TPR) repeat protein
LDGVEILRTGEAAAERHFLAVKPPNGFRVFVFGGSSEVGTPYGYEYGFAAFLQVLLTAALPAHAVEVVNCAVPGFASRRLLYAAREVSAYQPDLYIVSTGHNELVEQRLYSHLVGASPWVFELHQRARHLRTYVLFEDAIRWAAKPIRPEVEGEKIYVPMFGPMASKFWQDEPRDAARQRYYAIAMFQANVDAMIRVAQRAGADVLLLSQPKNYADWPVIGGMHSEGLSAEHLTRWQEHMRRAEAAFGEGDLTAAAAAYETALALDPGYAETSWRLAGVRRAQGRLEAAAELYRQARETGPANFGTTGERNAVLRDLAQRHDTLWIDMARVFEDASPGGLVGFNLFVDFLHPNLAGHELMARTIADKLRTSGIPAAATEWAPFPGLPPPAELYAAHPALRVLELKAQALAAIESERPAEAARVVAELRVVAPADPQLEQLEQWVAGNLPFKLGDQVGGN